MNVSIRLVFILFLMTSTAAIGCRTPANDSITSQRYQYTQLHLGVQVRIAVYAEKDETAQGAAAAAFQRIAELEDVFSNYRGHSELNRLAIKGYGKSTRVSPELFHVLDVSLRFSAETKGAFDVTLGPLTNLWRQTRSSGTLPPADTLAAIFGRVGWKNILLDERDTTVVLLAPGMQLDPGGIAKGYILDEALTVLREHGLDRALVEAGGDVVVGAPPPGKKGWTIEVPDAPAGSPIAVRASALKNAAIATSGDTEQFVTIDGVRYSHVIDPRTGLGVTSRRMATVVAPDGITADRFATALTVMGRDAADTLLAAHPEVLAYVRQAD